MANRSTENDKDLMRALVLEAYNELVVKDVPKPKCAANEVLVKVEACGICGSDVHGMDGSSGRRVPPLIMGHEAAGTIAQLGSEVRNWKEGDRVTFDSTVYPLNDWYTLNGHYNLSDGREVVGVASEDFKRHGAFAEYATVPDHILHRIPDTVSFEQAAMVEPIAVALHAVGLGEVRVGHHCAVVGAGTIGLMIIQLLRIAGADEIVVFDVDPANRERAQRYGATSVCDPKGSGAVAETRRRLEGRGADVVFEAVGLEASVNTAIELTRRGGTCILVGNLAPSVKVPLQKIVTGELRLQGSCAIRGEYPAALRLLENGRIDIGSFLAATRPLEEGVDWFERLRAGQVQGKVILQPQQRETT